MGPRVSVTTGGPPTLRGTAPQALHPWTAHPVGHRVSVSRHTRGSPTPWGRARQAELEAEIAQQHTQIDKSQHDLETMQTRLVDAKGAFDAEVGRKQKEVCERAVHVIRTHTCRP